MLANIVAHREVPLESSHVLDQVSHILPYSRLAKARCVCDVRANNEYGEIEILAQGIDSPLYPNFVWSLSEVCPFPTNMPHSKVRKL